MCVWFSLINIRMFLSTHLQAARRGHLIIVETLRKAGANLGGSDIDAGFVNLEFRQATLRGDSQALQVWSKAGADVATSNGKEDEINVL